MLSRISKLFSAAVLLAGIAVATPAAAQSGVELGLDGTISRVTSDGGDYTLVSIPVSRVRAGFYLNELVSIEPTLSIQWQDYDGGSLTAAALGAGLLYHFNGDRARTRPFVEGNVQLLYVSEKIDAIDFDESATQFALGGGVGVKTPMADRFDLRLEAFVQHALESDDFFSSTTFGVLFGFSFYTR
jgi:hypothetical protein